MARKTYPSETSIENDRCTGVPVKRLTGWKGHSNHLYFTNNGWWDKNRRLLFQSDRDNRTNLFSIELESGEISQITDADDGGYQGTFLNPRRDEAYFRRGPRLFAVDLHSGAERLLYTVSEPFSAGSFSVVADGQHVYLAETDMSAVDFPLALGTGYVGFRELFELHPHCRIVRLSVDGGRPEVIHEEDNWITHVNTSPTRKDLLSFCHEGPWDLVEQRMWGLSTVTGEVWKIREQIPEDALGHEYWLADGETLGYHGRSGGRPVFGFIRYDNTDSFEPDFHWGSNHFFSNTRDLIVGDGNGNETPYILLWRREGNRFSRPRILAVHRCSRHIQRTHVHPRFSPDGGQVLYTSDHTGYGQVYLVTVPAFDSLPELES